MKQFFKKVAITLLISGILYIVWCILFTTNEAVVIVKACIFGLICFIGFLHWLRHAKDLPQPKKQGCLHGKTNYEKIEFFKSLLHFYHADTTFFWEQFFDLQPNEKHEFHIWIKTDNHHKKHVLESK